MPRFDCRLSPVRALGAEGCRDLGDDRGVGEWSRMDFWRKDAVLGHLRGFLDDSLSSRPMGGGVAAESVLSLGHFSDLVYNLDGEFNFMEKYLQLTRMLLQLYCFQTTTT